MYEISVITLLWILNCLNLLFLRVVKFSSFFVRKMSNHSYQKKVNFLEIILKQIEKDIQILENAQLTVPIFAGMD